jgi:hypothetical protein
MNHWEGLIANLIAATLPGAAFLGIASCVLLRTAVIRRVNTSELHKIGVKPNRLKLSLIVFYGMRLSLLPLRHILATGYKENEAISGTAIAGGFVGTILTEWMMMFVARITGDTWTLRRISQV